MEKTGKGVFFICSKQTAAAWLRRWLWPLSGALGLVLAAALCLPTARFTAACNTVQAQTLRLHVRAAGDSVADQSAKLRVRDAVLQVTEPLCAAAQTPEQAKQAAARSLPVVALRAQQAAGQPVRVYMTNEYFGVRQYDGYTLPAGYYDALCVEIGSGNGGNWWCCLYPQICLAACSGYADEEAQALVVGGYQIKFRVAEWWQKLTRAPAEEADAAAPQLTLHSPG